MIISAFEVAGGIQLHIQTTKTKIEVKFILPENDEWNWAVEQLNNFRGQ